MTKMTFTLKLVLLLAFWTFESISHRFRVRLNQHLQSCLAKLPTTSDAPNAQIIQNAAAAWLPG